MLLKFFSMPEKITDKEVLERVVWDDADGYEMVKDIICAEHRWASGRDCVFKRLSDGKLFITHWRKGATEYQEHEYGDEAVEAESFTETVTHYRVKA